MQTARRVEPRTTSEEQYRLLVDAVVDYAIYLIDPHGLVSTWNSGARRLKGYEAGEIIGRHFSCFYTDEDRRAGVPVRALQSVMRDGRFEAEGWRVRKDDTRFWASVVIDAIRADDGTLLGFAKVTRDITERRNAQIELERAREALFQSQKMEALGQLTGGIAHDFNNLLTAILGGLDLLGKKLPQEQRTGELIALLGNIRQAAERGAWLTRRMLAFARREELELRPVDLRELVQGMTDLLRRSLGPAVTIEECIPPGLRPVQADPNQIELAVLNLAMNARDAMSGGGPVVLAAREEEVAGNQYVLEPGRYVCLSVTDTGEGMDAETLARAPEPFFTTKGAGKGTGLGLSMVHGMAEQSGGRLVLRSRKGEGTTAELWLRTVNGPSDVLTDRAEPRAAARPQKQLAVLAIDDDALVLMNTVLMLESLGHKVFSATSGLQALEIVRRGEPLDLVVTDEAMPQMRGSQFADVVRVERPSLPIVLATGYADSTPAERLGLPRLEKPFSQNDLARVISQVLGDTPA